MPPSDVSKKECPFTFSISEKNAPLQTNKKMMLLCFTKCLWTWNLPDTVIWEVNQLTALTEPLENCEGALGNLLGHILEYTEV